MKNLEVAKILRAIAELLEIKEENRFKIRAYKRAALVIENLSEDIGQISKEGKLEELPGIGIALAEKITEFLQKGSIRYYEDLKKEVPLDMESLGKIQGLGPKTIRKLYRQLGVKNTNDLEIAAKEHKIRSIGGLGAKVEENILKSIGFARTTTRIPLGIALAHAEELIGSLKNRKEIVLIDIAGSLRRRKDTIGDIDILACSKKPEETMDFFTVMKPVKRVLAHGKTRSSVLLGEGIQADLRIVRAKSHGAALLYFTGSQQHNIALRRIAISRGCKLNEYGLFDTKTNKPLAQRSEEEIYQKLGISFIEPELREGEDEIEAAKNGTLPNLVELSDIRGDLQMHSTWSDGLHSIQEMALAAKEIGHEYICITDHGGRLAIANAIDEKRFPNYVLDIEKVNEKTNGIQVLKGMEVNIAANGQLDVKNSLLKQMDIVLASIHSGFKSTKEQMTRRIIRAMENEHVGIIAHPTGRIISERPPYEMDFDAILDAAKRTGTALEINCSPERMDLHDVQIRAAIRKGIKLTLGTDAHSAKGLKNIPLGVYSARRGWAEKKDILNALPAKKLLARLK